MRARGIGLLLALCGTALVMIGGLISARTKDLLGPRFRSALVLVPLMLACYGVFQLVAGMDAVTLARDYEKLPFWRQAVILLATVVLILALLAGAVATLAAVGLV